MAYKVKEKEDKGFTGLYLGRKTKEHFRAVCYYNGWSLTTIIKELINEFLKDQPTYKEVIKGLAKQAHKEWEELCAKMHGKSGWNSYKLLSIKWNYFVSDSKKALSMRHFPKEIINQIIIELEYLESKGIPPEKEGEV